MNKQICILILVLIYRICNAQNLVPNPSFEDTVQCPDGPSQIFNAVGWFQPTLGTPDLLNVCNPFAYDVNVPQNFWGYQNPRTGNGYAAFFACFINWDTVWLDYREYCEVQLLSPLVAGTDYYLSFFVSLADSMNYATDAIGVNFSVDTVQKHSFFDLDSITPQIQNVAGNFIVDKTNWTRLTGKFTANGGEIFMTIGNFKNHFNTDTISVSGGAVNIMQSDYGGGYYYLDDICVSTDSLTCNPSVGINETITKEEFILSPNPFSNMINITTDRSEPIEVIFFDVSSRIIFNQSFTNSTTINTEQLAKGIYLYEVRNKHGVIKKGKLLKN